MTYNLGWREYKVLFMTSVIYLLTDFFTKFIRFLYVWLCFKIYATTVYWVAFIKKTDRFRHIRIGR